MTNKQVWGITGGIGSGKSRVAALLQDMGAFRIDADAIARELTQPGGAAMEPLVRAFGAAASNEQGGLNRAWMREQAFSDPTIKQQLEEILHPLIFETITQLLLAQDHRVTVIEIPLLFESYARWAHLLDQVWVVEASPETQIQRVQKRNQWPLTTIQAVLAQQARADQRRSIATVLIDNNTDDPLHLAQQVRTQAHKLGL